MMRHIGLSEAALSFTLILMFVAAGCTSPKVDAPPPGADAGTDAKSPEDADSGDEPDADGSDEPDADTGGEPDADTGDDPGYDGEGPQLVEEGTDGVLLRGAVLTPDEILEPGEVLVDGEIIVCVDTDCSEEADMGDFAVIETDGVISPGLIDAHNHLPYNFLPPWYPNPETTFNNRYEWADEAAYRDHIAPYADNRMRGTHYCPAAKWGELRSLVHGTTTIMGQSFQQRCVDWGVRNADHYHGLKHNHLRTTIDSPLNFTDDQAQNYIDSFEDDANPVTRLAVHMAEGHSGNGVEDEFDSFAGRDDRDNRHAGVSLLEYGTGMLIHSVTLTPPQLEEAYLYDAHIVWSPSSNFHLYGEGVTADIETMLEFDINTSLGPDWTVSGAFDMLEEMRVAYEYGQDQEIDALTPERIWEMATLGGAEAVGLHNYIGRLEPGYHADITVFARSYDAPHRAVLESRSADIELVLIDGDAYFGDATLEAAGRNDYCESFDACGESKFVCPVDSPTADDRADESVGDIEAKLIEILDGLEDAPEDEQYGRADDLLDLVICGI